MAGFFLKNNVLIEDMEYIGSNFENGSCFKDKTILITGCGGFLGFYFMNFFASCLESYQLKSIIAVDNFLLGEPGWLVNLKKNFQGKIEIIPLDIGTDDLSLIRDIEQVEYIIHLASIASPSLYRKYPLETIDANVWGLRNLLEFFKNRTLKGVLFFSSSEIYGDPPTHFIPTEENYWGNVSCLGPRACYDEAKRFGETLCYVFSRKYNIPITIVRPFNNYGPGMRLNDQRVPADLANAIINNKDIILFSDGSPTRTFCYVADAIIGYLKALTLGRFDFFNIGIDKPEISINDFATIYKEKGKELFGYNQKIRHKKAKDRDYLSHNPQRRCPDISKARRLLNYHPTIDVTKGVEKFLIFLRDEMVGGSQW